MAAEEVVALTPLPCGCSTNLFQPYSRISTALFVIYLYENQFSLDVVTDIAKIVSMKRLEGTVF